MADRRVAGIEPSSLAEMLINGRCRRRSGAALAARRRGSTAFSIVPTIGYFGMSRGSFVQSSDARPYSIVSLAATPTGSVA